MPVKKKKTFRVLVCGSRDWYDRDTIALHLTKLIMEAGVPYRDVLVITGGATGADTLAREICLQELGIANAEFNAAWDFYNTLGKKRAAGPVRNGWMLRWGKPDAVLAFHPYLPGSRGTKNMVEQAREAGVSIVRTVDKQKEKKK